MTDPARSPVISSHADRSTMESFAFGFSCGLCGKEWQGARYDFNPGNLVLPIQPAIFQLLWNEQHRAAFDRASLEASFEFNRCPLCGRWVCKACFYLSGSGISDICTDCLSRIKGNGDWRRLNHP